MRINFLNPGKVWRAGRAEADVWAVRFRHIPLVGFAATGPASFRPPLRGIFHRYNAISAPSGSTLRNTSSIELHANACHYTAEAFQRRFFGKRPLRTEICYRQRFFHGSAQGHDFSKYPHDMLVCQRPLIQFDSRASTWASRSGRYTMPFLICPISRARPHASLSISNSSLSMTSILSRRCLS